MSAPKMEVRAARVSMVTGVSTVLSVAMQLISVPICMKNWGQGTYGLWLTLLAALTLMRSLDGGYVTYVGNKLNYLYHVDSQALRKHLASALYGTTTLGAFQLLLAIGVAVSEPVAHLVGISGPLAVDMHDRLGLLVLVTSWVLTGSYLGVVHRLMIPSGLMLQAAWWSMASQVSQFAAIIVAALAGLNILQTSLLFALLQAAVYLSSAVYARRVMPRFYPWWQGGRPGIGFRDLIHSGAITAGSLVQQGASSGAVLLLASIAGPVAVPVFTTVRTLANLWTNVTNVLTQPLLPEVIRFHANAQHKKLLVTLRAHWVIVGGAVNASVLVAYPLLPSMYAHWTAHAMPLDRVLLAALLSAVVIANTGALMALHLNGLNDLRFVLMTSLLRFAVTLGFGAALYSRLGVASFGVGVLASELAALAVTASVFFRRVGGDLGTDDVRSLWPVALGATSVVVLLFVDALTSLPPPVSLVIAAGILVVSITWGWQGLPREIRARLLHLAMPARRRAFDRLGDPSDPQ